MRLAHVFVVRDEADLVADSIRFHASRGVDCFFVTDHGSTDGTTEILESLRDDFEIHLRREETPILLQGVWMTEMVLRARHRHGVDWAILSDADEFWVPRDGSLKDVLSASDAEIVDCPRTNMLPDRESVWNEDYRFFHNVWRVARPFPRQEARPDPEEPLDWPLFLRSLPGKPACATEGFSEVAYGNHGLKHAGDRRESGALDVLHFPVRRFAKFRQQTSGYSTSLPPDEELEESGRSWHQRRMLGLLAQKGLHGIYEDLLDDVDRYREGRKPRLQRDLRLWEALSPATIPEPKWSVPRRTAV